MIKALGFGVSALRSNIPMLSSIYKLNFAITYRCQSRCLECNIWQMKPKNELDIEEIRAFARENPYFKWIGITGGEPFLRDDIVEIAEAFAEYSKGLYILTIPTNSLCDHNMIVDKVSKILNLGIPKVGITVSLDGYRELHDHIRGVPGNYDRAIDLFKRLYALKQQYKNLFVVFGYTISRYNLGMFEKTFQEVKKEIPSLAYNNFHINIAQLSSHYYNNTHNEILPSGAEAAKEIENIRKSTGRKFGAIEMLEYAFLKRLSRFASTGRSPMRSRGLEVSVFMDSYGNVYPSIMWDVKIGNIRESNYSLGNLLSTDLAKKIKADIKAGNEPQHWTSCEAYQSIIGDIKNLII